MKRRHVGWINVTSPIERFMRYGPYIGPTWRARIVLRQGASWKSRSVTNWPEEINLVTYSKTPVSRVVRKDAP